MAFLKNIAVASIVTRSYIPFARVLFDSIRDVYPHIPLYLLLVDKLEGDCSCGDNVEIITAEELNLPEFGNMLRRYSNTELCVALKPFAIKEIFRRSRDKIEGVIYFDSDIYVVSAMTELESLINHGSQIIITPHLNEPSLSGNTTDLVTLKCGAYNMGFAYFANAPSAHHILDWWGEWLKHFCYEDFTAGLFGDQKWMDILPCFTDEYKIFRHNGYNVAYWNIDQRPVTLKKNNRWFAGKVPLRFLHLSCPVLEPTPLFSKNVDRYDTDNLHDLPILMGEYAQKVLNAGFHAYASLPCLLRDAPLTRRDTREQKGASCTYVSSMSRKTKIICALLLIPAAFMLQLDGWRLAFRNKIRAAVEPIKRLGRNFMGATLTSPEYTFIVLRRQNSLIRSLVETPFLLSVFIRRSARSVDCLNTTLKEHGLDTVKAMSKEFLGLDVKPSRKSILVTDVRVPHHDMIASDLTTFHLLKDLVGFGYSVTFVPWGAPWPERYEVDLRRLGVVMDYNPAEHGGARDYVERFGSKYSAFYVQPMGLAAELLPVIRHVAPNARVVFHAADLCFVREQREAELSQNKKLLASAAKTKMQELDLIRKVDHLVVISEREKEFVLAEVEQTTQVSAFTCLYSKCQDSPAPFDVRKGVIFIGVFGHRPNVDAVLWFVRKVWPLVRKKVPDMVFHVVGNYAPPEIAKLNGKNGIVIEGFVKDLDPLLASVRVAVAPLRYGAGIKGKIGTTMGAGVPNVCTSIAVEGMSIENDKQALLADSPEDFAASVVRLHSEAVLWTQLSQAGLELVREKYSEEAGTEQFERVLREAGLWVEGRERNA